MGEINKNLICEIGKHRILNSKVHNSQWCETGMRVVFSVLCAPVRRLVGSVLKQLETFLRGLADSKVNCVGMDCGFKALSHRKNASSLPAARGGKKAR